MAVSSLPVEIQEDIFLRLPVNSIVASSCVCKVWHELLRSHNFTKTHFLHGIRNPKLMLRCPYLANEGLFRSIDYASISSASSTSYRCNGDIPMVIRDMFHNSVNIRMLGSCNGLICLDLHGTKDICIWNPSTGEYKKMQIPLFCESLITATEYTYKYGFGFYHEILADDYKLVCVEEKLSGVYQVNVYTFGSKSWKTIQSKNQGYHLFIHDMKRSFPAFLVNGALHWISYKQNIRGSSSIVIVSFDVSREEFVDILFPESSEMYWAVDCVVGLLEECLCLGIYYKHDHRIDVWLMQEYGVRASWTKRFSFSTTNITVHHNEWKLICTSTNGELLIHDGRGKLLYYRKNNYRCRVMKVHGVDDVKMQCSTPLNYLESLVSPNSIGYCP